MPWRMRGTQSRQKLKTLAPNLLPLSSRASSTVIASQHEGAKRPSAPRGMKCFEGARLQPRRKSPKWEGTTSVVPGGSESDPALAAAEHSSITLILGGVAVHRCDEPSIW